jgi:hypothetical protein
MDQEAASEHHPGPFEAKDCALLSIATGLRAQTLKEFRDGLLEVPASSIYHHFWARLLRPRFDEPEYSNDFAAWAYHALHEKPLAERLSMANPAEFEDLEALRQELAEIVEQRLDESEFSPWARADDQFHFLQARVVIFDTDVRIDEPGELPRILPELPTGSIYYHFIDAPRRTDRHRDDLSTWLAGFGAEHQDLIADLRAIDPYFASLKETRNLLAEMFRSYFEGTPHG